MLGSSNIVVNIKLTTIICDAYNDNILVNVNHGNKLCWVYEVLLGTMFKLKWSVWILKILNIIKIIKTNIFYYFVQYHYIFGSCKSRAFCKLNGHSHQTT